MPALSGETPEFFPRGPSPRFRLALCAVLSLILMFADARYHYLEGIRTVVGNVLSPVQRVVAMPAVAMRAAASYFREQHALVTDNGALRQQLLDQAIAVQGYESVRQENERLRAMLGLRPVVPGETVGAEVLYSGRDPFRQKVVIDAGESRGVRAGMAVIDASGVLGQVTRAYATLAEVTLITDKDHLVPVQVQRSGVRTVLYGSGAERMPELRFLPPNADIKVGDRLVTSGIDGVYPPGLAVADVVSIDRDPARVFPQVVCRPVAGVERSRQLMVLSFTAPPAPPPDPDPAAEEPARKGARGRRG